jgi:hypothetical protein
MNNRRDAKALRMQISASQRLRGLKSGSHENLF